MRVKILWILAIVALSSGRLRAQDVVGDWQGTLEAGTGYRIVVKIAKSDSGGQFAPKLALSYHVYGVTRRGYGVSSAPVPTNGNYSADRLGDDVLAVFEALKLNRPVLVGHSIAGEELSSIATRHPEKVAGLIYLDAAYSYAFYDSVHGDLDLDTLELKTKLDQLMVPGAASDAKLALIQSLEQSTLPQFEKDLQAQEKELGAMHFPSYANNVSPIDAAILAGEEKYTDIRVPILAIFALPHDLGSNFQNDPATRAALEASDLTRTTAQVKAVEKAIPFARVVRLPHASHSVFVSNEADVLREMNAFIGSLP
jgi:non-heme chloroperoxidase